MGVEATSGAAETEVWPALTATPRGKLTELITIKSRTASSGYVTVNICFWYTVRALLYVAQEGQAELHAYLHLNLYLTITTRNAAPGLYLPRASGSDFHRQLAIIGIGRDCSVGEAGLQHTLIFLLIDGPERWRAFCTYRVNPYVPGASRISGSTLRTPWPLLSTSATDAVSVDPAFSHQFSQGVLHMRLPPRAPTTGGKLRISLRGISHNPHLYITPIWFVLLFFSVSLLFEWGHRLLFRPVWSK